MRSKPNASQWTGRSQAPPTLVTATARIGGLPIAAAACKGRNKTRAVTKARSPRSPCVPMVVRPRRRSPQARNDLTAAPAARCAGSFSLQHQGGEHEPADAAQMAGYAPWRAARRESRIAEMRKWRPTDERQQHALSPSDRAKSTKSRAMKGRKANSGPDKAMKHDSAG